MGQPAHNLPEENRPDIRPDLPQLRAMEGGGEGDGLPSGDLSSAPDDEQENAGDDNGDGKSLSKSKPDNDDDKSNDEDSSNSDENEPEGSFFNKDGDGKQRFAGAKNLVKKLGGNKLLMGGALAGGGGLTVIVVVGVLLLGSLKIPNLMEHITSYQFARVTRQMVQSSSRVNAAKVVLDSADESAYAKFKAKYYSKPVSKVGDKWAKLDKYRPQKVISNLDRTGSFKLEYNDQTFLGRPRLSGVVVNGGTTIPVERPTGLTKYLPGVKLANDINYASKVAPYLEKSIKTPEVGRVIRGTVAKEIRQQLGISLIAWKIGQFKGKNAEQAGLEQARTLYSVVDDGKVQPSSSSVLDGAAEKAKEIEKANLSDDKKLAATLANSSIDAEALASVEASIKPSFASSAISVANPIYGFAVPLCIIYDGSLDSSGSTITHQTTAQKKTYYYFASAADQQKHGYDADARAAGALNKQLADISTSIPELRASGKSVDTSNEISTQASAGGSFSLFDALPLPKVIAQAGNKLAESCPVLTNPVGGVLIGLANIALLVGTGGTSGVVEGGADVAVTGIVRGITTKLVASFATKAAARATARVAVGKAGVIFKDVGSSAVKITGATLLAKLVVYSRMNSLNNGLQSGKDLTSSIDSGAILAAGDLSQKQFFGAPLAKSAVVVDAISNQNWLNSQEQSKNLSTRYIALSNPNSLVNKLAISLQSQMGAKGTSIVTNMFASISGTVASLPSFLFSTISGHGHAADLVSNSRTYYGNVQFGFSPEEESLLQNDPSYSVLDNQQILDDSGKEKEIATKYARCFGYTSDDNAVLTMDGPDLGELLAKGDIKRNEAGDVLEDNSLCSPKNLSFKNPDYQDLVFRWRVANSDNKAIDQLTDAQDIKPDDKPGQPVAALATSTGSGAVGDPQTIAKSILTNKNIDLAGYSISVKNDVEAAAQGKPGTAGAMTSAAVLNLIAAVGKDHRVLVTAIQSNGQGHSNSSRHYVGDAVDFGSSDGTALTGRDPKSIEIINLAFRNLKAAGIGQVSCQGATVSLPIGFQEFDDSCNHLHIEVPRGTP